MTVALRTRIFLVVCILSCATDSMAASVGLASITQAEQRLRELSKIVTDIKNVVHPRTCKDILNVGQRSSGLYTIFPLSTKPTGQIVYCDMNTDGGGWTVIQRRGQFGNNAYYFYRNWTEYAAGFGDPDKEYWIGNKALHALTTSGPGKTALKILLTNGTGESASLHYQYFIVSNEEDSFKLSLGKYVGPEGWDAMRQSDGWPFSTYDKDNDGTSSTHCAKEYRGAWWHNRCSHANLNGLNLNGHHESFGDGIEWSSRGNIGYFYHYSYPHVVMMVRADA